MSVATAIELFRRWGRRCLLAWLACAGMASSAVFAQADEPAPGVITPDTPAPDAIAPDVVAPDVVAADTTDPAGGAEAADVATATGEPAANDVTASEQFLADTLTQFGRKSFQAAEAYVGLADAQRQAGEYDAAAESYLAAVEVYRAVEGPFTPLVIPPLTSLGDNYYDANDNVSAISIYSEARTVSRRVYGLHNEEQIVLLDRLSRSLLDMNQATEAEEQQVEALRLIQRSNPPGSEPVLAAIYKYAGWLGARSMYQFERDQYTRAQRMIRNVHGDDDIREVTPLLGIGNSYRRERNPSGLGLSALEDALAILQRQPQQDPLGIATALRDIGDWAVAFGEPNYKGAEYRRAWTLLDSAPDGDRLRREWFFAANYVLYEPISSRGLSTDRAAKSGHVQARFDIDTRGSSSNVAIVESDPAGFKDEAVLRHIRRSRFRPLIAGGELIRGEGLAIQFRFRYAEDALATEAN